MANGMRKETGAHTHELARIHKRTRAQAQAQTQAQAQAQAQTET